MHVFKNSNNTDSNTIMNMSPCMEHTPTTKEAATPGEEKLFFVAKNVENGKYHKVNPSSRADCIDETSLTRIAIKLRGLA